MKRRVRRTNVDTSDRQSVTQAIFDAKERKKELRAALIEYDDTDSVAPAYSTSLSLLIYDAFSNHGVTAYNTGLFEQPQQWFDAILYLSQLNEFYELDYEISHLQRTFT